MQKKRTSRTSLADQCRLRGIELLESGHLEDAVLALRLAVELNPHSSESWNDLGVVMEALGNPREAMHCYQRALSVKPSHIEARTNLGCLMLEVSMAQALRHSAFPSAVAC